MTSREGGGAGVLAALGARLRDGAARALLAFGLVPDVVTWAGFVVSLFAAAFLVMGAGHHSELWPVREGVVIACGPWGSSLSPTNANTWWPVLASAAIALAGFLDVVDGSMARLSGRATRWGGVLDSTLDRVSDLAIFGAIGVHFALRRDVALSTLAWLALSHGFLIAYLRSRTEVIVAHAAVGFWQRTERNTVLGIAAALGHIPAALLLLGTLPLLTAWRRWRHVGALLRDAPDPEARPRSAWLFPWRQPRGSLAYGLICALLIAWIAWGAEPLVREIR